MKFRADLQALTSDPRRSGHFDCPLAWVCLHVSEAGVIARPAESQLATPLLVLLEGIPFASGLGDLVWVLYGLARSLKPEVCVEIGSVRGKSACYVGLALEENGKGKLYAIDPHTKTEWNDSNSVETYEVMRQNLGSLGLLDRVEIVWKTSGQAALSWNMPIDLIFIDGDHSYEGVKRDWELFTPHLAPFGVVVFHDTAWEIDPVSRASTPVRTWAFPDSSRS